MEKTIEKQKEIDTLNVLKLAFFKMLLEDKHFDTFCREVIVTKDTEDPTHNLFDLFMEGTRGVKKYSNEDLFCSLYYLVGSDEEGLASLYKQYGDEVPVDEVYLES